jgi:hypothetical protein
MWFKPFLESITTTVASSGGNIMVLVFLLCLMIFTKPPGVEHHTEIIIGALIGVLAGHALPPKPQ